MEESMLQLSQFPVMPFSEFLEALFHALDGEGVRYCFLRNYEGFPAKNVGGDNDILISPFQLPSAMRALQSIQGIRIIGYIERFYSGGVFLEGSSAIPGVRSLIIDFRVSLSWKGLSYLHADDVLRASVPRQAGNLNFFVPSPVHEAIDSLFASLLLAGFLKEKYFPQTQRTFASSRSEVIAALSPQFGLKSATRLVNAVIDGDRRKILGCVGSLRASLALRSLLHRPFRSVAAIARHNAYEIADRYLPKTSETICVFGPDGGVKSKLIEGLMPILESAAKFVQRHHSGPRFLFVDESSGKAPSADFHAQTPSRYFTSMAKVVQWLVEEWLSLFAEKTNLTLRISDRSYADLLTDPKGYGYGGPMWFARFAGKLFPSPDLWILLDPSAEGLQSGNQVVPRAEKLWQLEAYRAFVKTKKSYIILDGSKPVASLMEEAYAAIINTLAQRADAQLICRFCTKQGAQRKTEY
jgi:hypothetical protein